MKKVLYFLMCAVMLGMVSCTQFNGYDFESVMTTDHSLMISKYGDNVNFFETQGWFDQTIDVVDGNRLVKIENVFQYKDTAIMIYHFADKSEIEGLIEYSNTISNWHEYTIDTNKNDYTFTLVASDAWVEDQRMNLDSMYVDMDSALVLVRELGCAMPITKFVVLRQPVKYPPYPTHPYYIFGDIINCIAVDSKTGDVVTEF